MTEPSVIDHFAAALQGTGTRHVFGYPGGATVEVTEHLHQVGIEFVLTRSETAAGYMASAYGERTGNPGVVVATLGPGATSLVNPAAHALMDRSPLLIMTGCAGATRLTHQRLNQVSLFEPVTKWSTTVHAASFPHTLRRAWRTALAERPGPVHLDLASDVLAQPCAPYDPRRPLAPSTPEHYAGAPDVQPAAAFLAAAKRPVILAGYTALRLGAAPALLRFAEAWGIPVVTTAKAKGVFPEDHPLWAGVTDVVGRNLLNGFLADADVHVAVGFDTIEVITDYRTAATRIHIDPRPNLEETYDSDLELLGGIDATLASLSALAPATPRPAWDVSEIAEHRTALLRAVSLPPRDDVLTPTAVSRTARAVLPPETIAVTDVGAHKLSMAMHWQTTRPDTYMLSNGLGTMGYGLPASVAIKLAHPDVPVVCFAGDGGFLMESTELGTALERGAAIVVVVFNDGALEHIRLKQQTRGYAEIGTRMEVPDLVALAESFGAHGAQARTPGELEAALRTALSADRATVIDAQIDPAEYAVQFNA